MANPAGPPLLGVYVGGDASRVAEFETWLGAGREVDGVLAYTSGQGPDPTVLDPGWVIDDGVGQAGKPLLWSSMFTEDTAGVARYKEVADGVWDDTIRAHAQKMVDARAGDDGPIYLRTTWEIPGEWFPWSAVAVEDPETFKAAWSQWAEVVHSVSDRIKTVWDFNSDRGPVEQFYPGDKAVDVIGQDIYWTREYQGDNPKAAFEKTRSGYERGLDWMADFAKEHGKPVAISEWAATGPGADEWIGEFQEWIREMEGPDGPGVAYVTYWNDNDAYPGRVDDGTNTNGEGLRELWDEFGDAAGEAPPPAEPPSEEPPEEPPPAPEPPGQPPAEEPPAEPPAGEPPVEQPEEPNPMPTPAEMQAAMLVAVNDAREAEGLDAVTLSEELAEAADAHVDYMVEEGTFSARDAEGEVAAHAVALAADAGEDGLDEADAAAVVERMLAKPQYAEALLAEDATEIGVAVSTSDWNGLDVSVAAAVLEDTPPEEPPTEEPPTEEPPTEEPPTEEPPVGEPAQQAGSGPDELKIRVSHTAPAGQPNAEFAVRVDGVYFDDVFDAHAVADDDAETPATEITLNGDWAEGGHVVDVVYLNDRVLADGEEVTEGRSLTVESAQLNGDTLENVGAEIEQDRAMYRFAFNDGTPPGEEPPGEEPPGEEPPGEEPPGEEPPGEEPPGEEPPGEEPPGEEPPGEEPPGEEPPGEEPPGEEPPGPIGGNDATIRGGECKDTIEIENLTGFEVDGRDGRDHIILGEGTDDGVIILESGLASGDRITGFESGAFQLELRGYGEDATLEHLGEDRWLAQGAAGADVIVLDGFTSPDALTEADYVFV